MDGSFFGAPFNRVRGHAPAGDARLRLNPDHPLARGLRGLWLLGRGWPINLVTGERAPASYGADPHGTQRIGLAGPCYYGAGAAKNGWQLSAGALIAGQAEWTIAAHVVVATTAGTWVLGHTLYAEQPASGSNRLELDWGRGQNAYSLIYTNDAGETHNAVVASDHRANRPRAVSGCLRPGGTGKEIKVFVDGVAVQTVDWGTKSTAQTAANFATLGVDHQDSFGASQWLGDAMLVAVAERGWSDAEHGLFADDPWALLIDDAEPILAKTPAGGAALSVSASLTASATLTATAARQAAAAAALAPEVTLQAVAARAAAAAAALTGDVTLTATAIRAAAGSATLTAAGALTAAATRQAAAVAALAAQGTVTAVATRQAAIAALLSGEAAFAAVVTAQHAASAALTVTGTLTVTTAQQVSASLSATVTLTAVATRQAAAAAALTASGEIAAVASRQAAATALLSGAATLTASATAQHAASATLTVTGTLTAVATLPSSFHPDRGVRVLAVSRGVAVVAEARGVSVIATARGVTVGIAPMSISPKRWPAKDPSDEAEYWIDWAAEMALAATPDTIAAVDWTVPAGLTAGAARVAGAKTFIWLSGGTAGTEYVVTCRIDTAGGSTLERSVPIAVRNL